MRFVIPLCFLVALSGSLAWGATYVVTPDGTGDYPTIQAAVDAAQNGDIIELSDGTFVGDGNRNIGYLGKAITIRSQSGDPHTCTIDCESLGRAFHGNMPGSLEGVTVTGGNSDNFGGAISIYDGNFTVHNCIFIDNQAIGNAGAIFIDFNGYVTCTECSFIGNSSFAGGAICT